MILNYYFYLHVEYFWYFQNILIFYARLLLTVFKYCCYCFFYFFANNCEQPAVETECMFLFCFGQCSIYTDLNLTRPSHFTVSKCTFISTPTFQSVQHIWKQNFARSDHVSATQIVLFFHTCATRPDHYMALFSWPNSQHNSC